MNLRAVAALVLAGAVVAAVLALSRPATTLDPRPAARVGTPGTDSGGVTGSGTGGAPGGRRETPFQTSAECRACHEDVYAEWKTSYHAMAWTDPMVQQLSGGFTQPECIDCHAPLPIHVTGVSQRVAPRRHAREDGVDCISCHVLEDGVSVAASRTVDTSATPGACRPVATDSMTKVDACAGCHNQHETVNELAESGIGKTCSDCHMRPVARKAREGRSHVFPGGHDVNMLIEATKLEVSIEGGEVVAKLHNVGAGHKIPTDARHRSFNVWVSAFDAKGNPWVADQMIGEARLYYRDQFKESTQVAAGKALVSRWAIPKDFRGRVVVRLTYALNPEELRLRRVTEVAKTEVEVR